MRKRIIIIIIIIKLKRKPYLVMVDKERIPVGLHIDKLGNRGVSLYNNRIIIHYAK